MANGIEGCLYTLQCKLNCAYSDLSPIVCRMYVGWQPNGPILFSPPPSIVLGAAKMSTAASCGWGEQVQRSFLGKKMNVPLPGGGLSLQHEKGALFRSVL